MTGDAAVFICHGMMTFSRFCQNFEMFVHDLLSVSYVVVFQVLRGGTLSDKVAALTLQVQESPVHRLSVFDGLLDLGLKKERRTVSCRL